MCSWGFALYPWSLFDLSWPQNFFQVQKQICSFLPSCGNNMFYQGVAEIQSMLPSTFFPLLHSSTVFWVVWSITGIIRLCSEFFVVEILHLSSRWNDFSMQLPILDPALLPGLLCRPLRLQTWSKPPLSSPHFHHRLTQPHHPAWYVGIKPRLDASYCKELIGLLSLRLAGWTTRQGGTSCSILQAGLWGFFQLMWIDYW